MLFLTARAPRSRNKSSVTKYLQGRCVVTALSDCKLTLPQLHHNLINILPPTPLTPHPHPTQSSQRRLTAVTLLLGGNWSEMSITLLSVLRLPGYFPAPPPPFLFTHSIDFTSRPFHINPIFLPFLLSLLFLDLFVFDAGY